MKVSDSEEEHASPDSVSTSHLGCPLSVYCCTVSLPWTTICASCGNQRSIHAGPRQCSMGNRSLNATQCLLHVETPPQK